MELADDELHQQTHELILFDELEVSDLIDEASEPLTDGEEVDDEECELLEQQETEILLELVGSGCKIAFLELLHIMHDEVELVHTRQEVEVLEVYEVVEQDDKEFHEQQELQTQEEVEEVEVILLHEEHDEVEYVQFHILLVLYQQLVEQ